MAEQPKPKKGPVIQTDDDWMPEGAEGAESLSAAEWMPEGTEGADADPWTPEALREQIIDTVAPPVRLAPVEVPQIGAGETALNRAVDAIPLGGRAVDALSALGLTAASALGVGEPGAVLTPQAREELAAMGTPATPEVPRLLPRGLDAYRRARDVRAARTDLGALQNPNAALAGTAAGIGLSMLAPLPKANFGKGAQLRLGKVGARAAEGAVTGAGYGALTGLTEGDHDLTRGEWERASQNTALGAGLGATIGTVLPVMGTAGWKMRAGLGGALGTIYGATSAPETASDGESAFNAALYGLGGAAGGVAVPLALRAAHAGFKGVVNPTRFARYLRSKGVPLTVGQMNPNSALAQVEEASTSVGGIGPQINEQRMAGRLGWQSAVLDEARPPGVDKLNPNKAIDERLGRYYNQFDEAYAPARGHMIEPRTAAGVPLVPVAAPPPTPPPPSALPPALVAAPGGLPAAPATATVATPAPVAPPPALPTKLPRARDPLTGRWLKGGHQPQQEAVAGVAPALDPTSAQASAPTPATPAAAAPPPSPKRLPKPKGVFDEVVEDPSVLATGEDRRVVRKFLENELTLIAKQAEQGKVPSEALLKLRSDIRAKASQELKAENYPKAQMLENAERRVTEVLERSLPKEATAALRTTDPQYAKHKVVEKAVASSGDQPGGFTPAQLSGAIRGDMDRGTYARGGGGELRRLARAGREVLDARVPMTGARLMATGPLQWPAAAFSYGANLPKMQKVLLGETKLQRGYQGLARYINRNPYEAEVNAMLPRNQSTVQDDEMERQRALAEALLRLSQNPQ